MIRNFLRTLAFLSVFAVTSAHAVACYWVGGSGTWDQTNTGGGGSGGIKWASSTGGGTACTAVSGPAAGVPGPSDIATFDASSGGGTVTVAATINSTNTIQSIVAGTFTSGTLDFATNNTSITFNAAGFSGTGTVARTINRGTGTFTFTGAGSWDLTTTTLLTWTAGSGGTYVFTSSSTTGQQAFHGGSKDYGASSVLTVNGRAAGTGFAYSGSNTLGTINLTGPLYFKATAGASHTVGSLNITGTLTAPVVFGFDTSQNTAVTFNVTSSAISYAVLRSITFGTSAVNPTNSWDLGNNNFNSGSLSTPSGGSGGKIIGG